jgi:PadR family transcriptional regulator, regulatory protein PadR
MGEQMPRDIIESVQGTLDFLILKTLTWDAMHGYAIVRWIREQSGEELQIEEGTLYPALHRLEDQGLVEAEWGLSENRRRAKYYRLTADGRRDLARRHRSWERYSRAINRVLAAAPSASPDAGAAG